MKLIEDIIRFRVAEERKRLGAKSSRQKSSPWSALPAPAQRALEKEKIRTLEQLSNWSKHELLDLHGLGPGSIPILQKILRTQGLKMKQ